MEIKNKLAVTRGEGGRGKQGKEGEETCIEDPWKTGWGLTVGVGSGRGGESNGGEIGTIITEQQKKPRLDRKIGESFFQV